MKYILKLVHLQVGKSLMVDTHVDTISEMIFNFENNEVSAFKSEVV